MKRVLPALLLVLVVTMVGCKTRTGITFHEDGSGTFSSSLEMTDREIKLLSEEGNPIDVLVENAEGVSFPVAVERIDTEEGESFSASFEFDGIADMQEKLTELNQEDDGSSTLFKDAEVTSTDDGWTFEAESGGTDAGEVEEFIDPAELEKLIDSQVTVTLPGEQGKNNATSVDASEDETTFVWKLSPGTPTQLSAATVFPDSLLEKIGGPVTLVVAAVVLLLVAAYVVRARRAKPAAG